MSEGECVECEGPLEVGFIPHRGFCENCYLREVRKRITFQKALEGIYKAKSLDGGLIMGHQSEFGHWARMQAEQALRKAAPPSEEEVAGFLDVMKGEYEER